MNLVVWDRLLELKSKAGGSYLRIYELYFARSKKYLIEMGEMGKFKHKEVTVIYLSFTNVRISIALPGGGVVLEGGTRGNIVARHR